MKKLIVLLLMTAMLLTSMMSIQGMAAYNSSTKYFDFSDLEIGEQSATFDDTYYGVKEGVAYSDGDGAKYNAVFVEEDTSAQSEKKLVLKSNQNKNFGFRLKDVPVLSNYVEIGFNVKFNDLNAQRRFGTYDCHASGRPYMFRITTAGYLYLVGKSMDSSYKVKAGDKLDVVFRINMTTGDARAIVKKDGADWIDITNAFTAYISGNNYVYSSTKDSAYGDFFIYQHDNTADTVASSEWSNIYVRSVESLANTEMSYDFDDLGNVGSTYTGVEKKIEGNVDNVTNKVASDADGGKRLMLTSSVYNASRLIKIYNPDAIGGVVELGFDLELTDLNKYRYFGGIDCWHSSTSYDYLLRIDKSTGYVCLNKGNYSSGIEGKSVAAGDKLNIRIWLDMSDGWLRLRMLKNGKDFIDKTIEGSCSGYTNWNGNSTGQTGILEDMVLYQHEGNDVESTCYFDNYYLRKCTDAKEIFTVNSGLTVEENTASFKASTKYDYTKNLLLVIAEYTDNGGSIELEAIKAENVAVSGDSKTYSARIALSGKEGTSLKAFLWDAKTLTPIADPVWGTPEPES